MAIPLLPPRDDSAGWGALQEKMVTAAYGAVRNHEIAHEASQETLCKVFESGLRDPNGQPIGVGLLLVRVVSRAIDMLRRQSREAERIERLRQSPRLKHIDDPQRLLAAADLIDRVYQFLDELEPPERREMLRMVFVEGLTYQQACERWPQSESTARSRVYRGLRALRERIKAEGLMDVLWEELS